MEKGSAEMILSLDKGVIKVRRPEGKKYVLFTGTAKDGAWDRILKAIIRNCENPTGPMAERF